jgi:hypothetical protein
MAHDLGIDLRLAPPYHAAPLRYCIAMHRFGVPVVVLEKFDPEQALDAIERPGEDRCVPGPEGPRLDDACWPATTSPTTSARGRSLPPRPASSPHRKAP